MPVSSSLQKLTTFRCPEISLLQGTATYFSSLEQLELLDEGAAPGYASTLKQIASLRRIVVPANLFDSFNPWVEEFLPGVCCQKSTTGLLHWHGAVYCP